jgi:hypothetical protein
MERAVAARLATLRARRELATRSAVFLLYL